MIDIACGTGAVLLYLAEHGVKADGTDISEEMCRVCAKKAELCDFEVVTIYRGYKGDKEDLMDPSRLQNTVPI